GPLAQTATAPDPTAILVGAGEVERCENAVGAATARLLDTIPGTVFTTGDNIRLSGSLADFTACYDPTWGRHKGRTRPAAGPYGAAPVRAAVKPLWDALYDAGAAVVLNGHDRLYERFAPQTPEEVADPEHGIRQFTVGTGGHGVNVFGTTFRPNSEVRLSGVY